MFSDVFSVLRPKTHPDEWVVCGISHSHRRLRRASSRRQRPFSRQFATVSRQDATLLRHDATLLRHKATVSRTFATHRKNDLRQIAFHVLTTGIRVGEHDVARTAAPQICSPANFRLGKLGDDWRCGTILLDSENVTR